MEGTNDVVVKFTADAKQLLESISKIKEAMQTLGGNNSINGDTFKKQTESTGKLTEATKKLSEEKKKLTEQAKKEAEQMRAVNNIALYTTQSNKIAQLTADVANKAIKQNDRIIKSDQDRAEKAVEAKLKEVNKIILANDKLLKASQDRADREVEIEQRKIARIIQLALKASQDRINKENELKQKQADFNARLVAQEEQRRNRLAFNGVVKGNAGEGLAGGLAFGLGLPSDGMMAAMMTGQKLQQLLSSVEKSGEDYLRNQLRFQAASGGDKLAGNREFEYIQKVANEFGQKFDTALTAFGRFQGASIGTQNQGEPGHQYFEAIMTIAHATGTTDQQLSRLIYALEKIETAGVLTGIEMNQLYKDLPGSVAMLARGMDITVGELREQVKARQITSEMVRNAFISQARDQYAYSSIETRKGPLQDIARFENALEKYVSQPMGVAVKTIEAAFAKLGTTIINKIFSSKDPNIARLERTTADVQIAMGEANTIHILKDELKLLYKNKNELPVNPDKSQPQSDDYNDIMDKIKNKEQQLYKFTPDKLASAEPLYKAQKMIDRIKSSIVQHTDRGDEESVKELTNQLREIQAEVVRITKGAKSRSYEFEEIKINIGDTLEELKKQGGGGVIKDRGGDHTNLIQPKMIKDNPHKDLQIIGDGPNQATSESLILNGGFSTDKATTQVDQFQEKTKETLSSPIPLNIDLTPTTAKVLSLKDKVDSLNNSVNQIMQESSPTSLVPGFATGGRVPGFGGGDTFRAMLTPGEWVINAQRSALFSPLLNAINYEPLHKVQNILNPRVIQNATESRPSEIIRLDLNLPGLPTLSVHGRADAVRDWSKAMKESQRGRVSV